MTDTPARRPACARCQLPLRGCLCAWLRPVHNSVPLLVLQHPAEATQAKNSLRLLRLSLSDCRCVVAEQVDAPSLAAWLGRNAVLLYPGTAAANAPPLPAMPGPLVLLDGTWRQTRRLLALHPLLQALPRCLLQSLLPALPPSRYLIRKAQRPEQRSTLEAAALALGALESRPDHYAPLLQAFEGWAASQAAMRPGSSMLEPRPMPSSAAKNSHGLPRNRSENGELA